MSFHIKVNYKLCHELYEKQKCKELLISVVVIHRNIHQSVCTHADPPLSYEQNENIS